MYITKDENSLLKETTKLILEGKLKPQVGKLLDGDDEYASIVSVINKLSSGNGEEFDYAMKQKIFNKIVLHAWEKFKPVHMGILFEDWKGKWFEFMRSELYSVNF